MPAGSVQLNIVLVELPTTPGEPEVKRKQNQILLGTKRHNLNCFLMIHRSF